MVFPSTSQPLARALAERDFSEPTSVQSAVLEPETVGRDLLVSAQTGSGKTVAYGLAIASDLLGDAETMVPAAEPLALVVAPTRELALQVQRELEWLYHYADTRVIACVGGMDPRAERHRLAAGAHIVVGTPGRLRDHLERGALRIAQLRAVVLDEADEMLDLGFREDLEFILDATPQERRTLLFSATLPKDIVALARRFQNDALRISVTSDRQAHADIDYRAVMVPQGGIEHATVNLLRHVDSPIALVFCNTRESVRHMHAILVERGFAAVSLSGEMGQNERNRALQSLRDGQARVCIATDVAARGIDLPSLGLVIHAELPNNGEVLQHRSGRTGRAGRKGVSVLIVPPARRRRAEQLLNTIGVRAFWCAPPSPEEIAALDRERLLQSPILDGEITDEDRSLAELLLTSRTPEQIATALARLYRSQLPAAEEIVDGGSRDAGNRDTGAMAREPASARKKKAVLEQPGVWFRMAIGRDKNADPRWLLPLICRQGGITKQDIGVIRVFDRETKIEIDARVAAQFLATIRQDKKPEIRIEPMSESPADEAPRHDENRPPRRREQRADASSPQSDSNWSPHDAPPRHARARQSDDAQPPRQHRARPSNTAAPDFRGAKPYHRPKAQDDETPRGGGDWSPHDATDRQQDAVQPPRQRRERPSDAAPDFRGPKPPYRPKADDSPYRPKAHDSQRHERGRPPRDAAPRQDDEKPRRHREQPANATARDARGAKPYQSKTRTGDARRPENEGNKPLRRTKPGGAKPAHGPAAAAKPWKAKKPGGKKRMPKA